MTISTDARRIVEQALDSAIDIVDNKLHALKAKNEKEWDASSSRIIRVAQMLVDTRLHLEMLMFQADELKPEEEEELRDDDPELFPRPQTRRVSTRA